MVSQYRKNLKYANHRKYRKHVRRRLGSLRNNGKETLVGIEL